MIDPMLMQWRGLLSEWSADTNSADQAFDEIVEHYTEPSRYYHNLEHIQSMLKTVETLSPHALKPNEVKLATWLHDVIYDSKAADNEERSAAFAEELCIRLSIPDGRSIASLIIKTKTHDAGDDIDAQILLDADLAILGAGSTDYQSYREKIRREYAWVPESEYRPARRRILLQFLMRPRIYYRLIELEIRARANITAEIDAMSKDL